MPSGLSAAGLPLALQMIAAPHRESSLLLLAQAFEAAAGFEALKGGIAMTIDARD